MPIPDPWLPTDPDAPGVPAATVKVYRHSDEGPDSTLYELPNVEYLGSKHSEGPVPDVATFRYNLTYPATYGLDGAPSNLDEALDRSFTGDYTVDPGWRLSVGVMRPDGENVWLFDGHVLDFGGSWARNREEVTLVAHATPRRCFDTPMSGMRIRDSGRPKSTDPDDDVATDLLAMPNPKGAPNFTPAGYDVDAASEAEPAPRPLDHGVFLDVAAVQAGIKRGDWTEQEVTCTLPRLARYILARFNAFEEFVAHPDGDSLDALLVSHVPHEDDAYDPEDPDTYEVSQIQSADLPMNGRPWPSYLHQQVAPYGFGFEWALESDGAGLPSWVLRLYRKRAVADKALYLQARGETLDFRESNAAESNVGRALDNVANRFRVEGSPVRHECGLVLYQGFAAAPADSETGNIKNFDDDSAAFRDDPIKRDKYRLFVADEAGEGHWPMGGVGAAPEGDEEPTGDYSKDTLDLDDILGADKYARRRRKPLGKLCAFDNTGNQVEARLSLSADYEGPYGVWDGTGTWFEVTKGWKLLPDRLGIRVTADNPEKWQARQDPPQADFPFNGGVIRAVSALAKEEPAPKAPRFFLRLTVAFEADATVHEVAERTANSPLPYDVERWIDAGDRIHKWVVHPSSEWFESAQGIEDDDGNKVTRDDTWTAKGEAMALRLENEAGVMDVDPIEIPYLTDYYKVGDRIRGLEGRQLSFRTDSGGAAFQPVYPAIVAIEWRVGRDQMTILHLSDRGLDRSGYPAQGSRAAGAAAQSLAERVAAGVEASGDDGWAGMGDVMAPAFAEKAKQSANAFNAWSRDQDKAGPDRGSQGRGGSPAPASGLGGGLAAPEAAQGGIFGD